MAQHTAVTSAAVWPASVNNRSSLSPKVSSVPGTPVAIGGNGADAVEVSVEDRKAARDAGVNGVLLHLETYTKNRRSATNGLRLSLDYKAFGRAIGADYGRRLHLVTMPACALTTPLLARCRRQTRAQSSNDGRTTTLATTRPLAISATQPLVVAAVAGPSSSTGDFAASNLSPTGSWTAGGSSGSFNYTYPISVPKPATGSDVAPSVSLGYNSGSIDGQIASTNNQSSWIGEGWDYSPGYIERTYRTCSDGTTSGTPSDTEDKCWAGNIVTMNLGGSTTALVRDDTTGAWHPENDNGQQVQFLSGANNTANNGEYWVITTTDGTTYYFGRNILPGGSTSDQTNSVLTEPVYYQNAGDSPCYNPTFANSKCSTNLGWRWNLDYVVDPNGNAAAYHYTKESNFYGAANGTTPVGYDRAAVLDHIDYGLREVNGSIYAHPATNRVTFTSAQRCISDASFDCSTAPFNTANAGHWADTPQDQDCPSTGTCDNHAPTFWSRLRLTNIETSYNAGTGSTYSGVPIDTYSLAQSFAPNGQVVLQLDKIDHVGHNNGTTSQTLETQFNNGTLLANRVPNSQGQSDMYFPRIGQIVGETGLSTTITYFQPAGQGCTATTLPSDPANDTQMCFPVKWTPEAHSQPMLDYFEKYLVQEVGVVPADGRSPAQLTFYDYYGNPTWHADDNEVVKPADCSYGQFRGYLKVGTRFGNTDNSYDGKSDSQTSTITTYYRGLGGTIGDSIANDATSDANEYAGRIHEIQTFDSSVSNANEISAVINDLATKLTTATRAREGLPNLTANIVVTAKTRSITDEPGVSSTATMTKTSIYAFDSLGQQIQQTTAADNAPTTCTTTTYAAPTGGNTRYIYNRVTETVISQQACPAYGTAPTPVLSDLRTFYDGATTAGVPSRGLPTEIDTRLDATSTPYFGRAKATFDTAGRQLTATQYVNASDTTGRTTTTTYMPTLPATVGSAEPAAGPMTKTVVTNAKGQPTITTVDSARGLPTEVLDVANHKTDIDYDALGRVTGVWKPGQVHGTNPASVTYSYVVASSGPSSITTNKLVDTGPSRSYVTSISLLDSFGQQIQTQASAPNGNTDVTDSFRDSHGWIVGTYNRWAQSGTPTTSLASSPAAGSVDDRTETTFDGAGRAVLTTEYVGLTPTWSTKTIYGGNETTTLPPTGGIASSTFTNALGWTTALKQYTGTPTISGNMVTGTTSDTNYGYTGLGQQNSIISPSRTSTITYDRGGRITQQTNSDSGTDYKTWDDAGDLIQTKDAKGTVLGTTFDALGRKLATYDNTTNTAQNPPSQNPTNLLDDWTWDSVQAGQLSYSEHRLASGTIWKLGTDSYDGAGRPLSTTLYVPTSEAGFASSYTTAYSYTATGQVATMTPAAAGNLPNETLTYQYDNLGNAKALQGITSIVSAATYTAFNEPSQFTLGVGNQLAYLTYDYDIQTRRLSKQNLTVSAVQGQIENQTFAYDPSGNLTSSVDTEGNSSAQSETQCFRYDTLDRLTAAWSANDNCATAPSSTSKAMVAGPQAYWTSWTFTAAGLRYQQTQHGLGNSADATTTNSYKAAPQADILDKAITGTAVSSYSADANGNITGRSQTGANLSIGYDQENRTLSMSGAGGASDYVRDADGNELLRHDLTTTTLYLPGEELVRTTSSGLMRGSRYYTFNGTEVAMRNSATAANPYWVLPDKHGSNQIAVTTLGSGIGAVIRRYLDPYGNPLGTVSGGAWPDAHAFDNKPSVTTTGTSTVAPVVDVGAREYEPSTGRFLSADPVFDSTDPQSINGYDYADNNPLRNSDPTGLHQACEGACSGAANPSAGSRPVGIAYPPPPPPTPSRNCWGPGGENLCGATSGGVAPNTGTQQFFNNYLSALLGGPPATVGAGVGLPAAPGSLTMDDIADNPQLLLGLNPPQLLELLGDNLPPEAKIGPGQSSSAGRGPGWKLTRNTRGNVTLRWSPGSKRPDHSDEPYWRVSRGGINPVQSQGVAAGEWPDAPSEYVWPDVPSLPSIGDGKPTVDPPPTDDGPCACGGARIGGGGVFDDDGEPDGPGKLLEDFDI